MNVKSAFLLAKDVIPLMEKRGFVDLLLLFLMDFKGAVLFISSPKYAYRFYKLTKILRVQHILGTFDFVDCTTTT